MQPLRLHHTCGACWHLTRKVSVLGRCNGCECQLLDLCSLLWAQHQLLAELQQECTHAHQSGPLPSSPCCSLGSDQSSEGHLLTSGVPGLQDVQPHLQTLDRKLFAVENVAGRHMAVDEMADMLGVAVPVVSVGGAPACWVCVWSGQHAGVRLLVSVWSEISVQAFVVRQIALLRLAVDATLLHLKQLRNQQAAIKPLPAALQLSTPEVASCKEW